MHTLADNASPDTAALHLVTGSDITELTPVAWFRGAQTQLHTGILWGASQTPQDGTTPPMSHIQVSAGRPGTLFSKDPHVSPSHSRVRSQ